MSATVGATISVSLTCIAPVTHDEDEGMIRVRNLQIGTHECELGLLETPGLPAVHDLIMNETMYISAGYVHAQGGLLVHGMCNRKIACPARSGSRRGILKDMSEPQSVCSPRFHHLSPDGS